MTWRLLGAILLIVSSGGIGYRMAAAYRKEFTQLTQIKRMIDHIICNLQWLQSPLPQIIQDESAMLSGDIRSIFREYALQMDAQITPNASYCMKAALSAFPGISPCIRKHLLELGESLGRFDRQGQLLCLQGINSNCANELESIEKKLPDYTRCCHAYSLCMGIVLALMLL